MEIASLQEIKSELKACSPEQLVNLCLRMAKFKKENKELLGYLLFSAEKETEFIKNAKLQMDTEFTSLNLSQMYLAKKTLRKALRSVNKFIRFSNSVNVEAALLLHFCFKLKSSGLPMIENSVVGNIYAQNYKKMNAAINKMHEDLQYDFRDTITKLNL